MPTIEQHRTDLHAGQERYKLPIHLPGSFAGGGLAPYITGYTPTMDVSIDGEWLILCPAPSREYPNGLVLAWSCMAALELHIADDTRETG